MKLQLTFASHARLKTACCLPPRVRYLNRRRGEVPRHSKSGAFSSLWVCLVDSFQGHSCSCAAAGASNSITYLFVAGIVYQTSVSQAGPRLVVDQDWKLGELHVSNNVSGSHKQVLLHRVFPWQLPVTLVLPVDGNVECEPRTRRRQQDVMLSGNAILSTRPSVPNLPKRIPARDI